MFKYSLFEVGAVYMASFILAYVGQDMVRHNRKRLGMVILLSSFMLAMYIGYCISKVI